jgi:broad specificity phosphatase PhoE
MSLHQSLIVLLCSATLSLPAAAAPDLVIVVRHAERATEPAGDPALTPGGEQRAQALAAALADARVNAILTTPFRRTRDTAAPLARALGITPVAIEARRGDTAGHVRAVAEAVHARSGTVLVVAHSNTAPAILAALGGPAVPEICETSFHHLFVLRPGAPAGLLRLSYGEPSGAPEAGCI